MRLTPTDQERIHHDCFSILEYVEGYLRQHGSSPSFRTIGAAVGIPSTDHVSRNLRKLEKNGVIRLQRIPGRRKVKIVVVGGMVPVRHGHYGDPFVDFLSEEQIRKTL